jgi:hypothetical protein
VVLEVLTPKNVFFLEPNIVLLGVFFRKGKEVLPPKDTFGAI